MDELREAFRARFGADPMSVARAPGRVNLIGEHTDYNDGLVLPAAIEREIRVAARPNGLAVFRVHATTYDTVAEFPAGAPATGRPPHWARYAQGVAVKMVERGIPLVAVDALIAGDLPIGAGLSSSAALEVACALTFETAAGVHLAPRARAHLCHQAEVEFVGVPCGIMDQLAVTLGRRGYALFLDCRSLQTHHVPLPRELVLAVCETGVRRSLDNSAYADRRRECREALHWLQTHGSPATSLRDLTIDALPHLATMPEPLHRRARHVVTENHRVIAAARALEGGEIADLRELFLASQRSLRDDYEVSSPELEAMVEAALESPGCVAARMTGAGFGGAVVALVQRGHQEEFLEAVAREYRRRVDREGVFFTSHAAAGAEVLKTWPA